MLSPYIVDFQIHFGVYVSKFSFIMLNLLPDSGMTINALDLAIAKGGKQYASPVASAKMMQWRFYHRVHSNHSIDKEIKTSALICLLTEVYPLYAEQLAVWTFACLIHKYMNLDLPNDIFCISKLGLKPKDASSALDKAMCRFWPFIRPQIVVMKT